MESGLINSIWNKIRRVEESHEEDLTFPDRVERAYQNKNTLEYAEAAQKAQELKSRGYTAEQLINMDEQAVAELCGREIIDPAVPVGALKKLEELEAGPIAQ